MNPKFLLRQQYIYRALQPATKLNQAYRGLHRTSLVMSFSTSPNETAVDPLPALPPTPRYPCPFITANDIEKYLSPHLYAAGWGISSVRSSDQKTTPPTTQLSKKVTFPNLHTAEAFMKDVKTAVIDPENHHPTWEVEDSDGSPEHTVILHVHTHSALAPPNDNQSHDETKVLPRKRPGITLRDIRFALLFEKLLRGYIHQGLINALQQPSSFYSQPRDINSIHDIQRNKEALDQHE